jgi:hypothetical protein
MRFLITEKLRGQLANVSEFFTLPDAESYIKDRISDAEDAESIEAIGGIEGLAAACPRMMCDPRATSGA